MGAEGPMSAAVILYLQTVSLDVDMKLGLAIEIHTST